MSTFFKDIYDNLITCINSYPSLPSGIPIQICDTDGRKTCISVNVSIRDHEPYLCGSANITCEARIFFQKAMQTNKEKTDCLDLMFGLLHYMYNNLPLGENSCIINEYPEFRTKNNNGLDVCRMSIIFRMVVDKYGE